MKLALLILLPAMSSCFAPSTTIYGHGIVRNKDGTSRVVTVKEVQVYGDLAGEVLIQGSVASIRASGGNYNSTVARENWQGATELSRATIQPVAGMILTGGVVGTAAGAVP